MKITLPIAASAIALALILTGCSAGALPGTSSTSGSNSGSGGSGGSNAGPTGNYSAADLVAILKKTETARGITGTIEDNAKLKALQAGGDDKSFTQEFTASGGTFVPASCGNLMNSLVATGEKLLNRNSWRGATLDATDDIISVAATSNAALTDAVLAKTRDIMGQLSSQCSTMTIKNSAISLAFKITPVDASTNASQTYAYEEDITANGTTTKTLTIEAVYGNLYIGDVSLTNPTLSAIEANVNAVVAASQ